MTRQRPRPQHQDSGATLILAIGFVLMVGAISAGLASLATSSLNNRTTLELVRNREYAADGAIEEAISRVRLAAGRALAVDCSAGGNFVDLAMLNGIAIRVDWRNACGVVRGSDGTVVAQRNVTFSACENSGAACVDTTVIIRAQVNFQQDSTGAVAKTTVQSWSVNR
jgi:hypothetical protein